jgi:hypothetical protein
VCFRLRISAQHRRLSVATSAACTRRLPFINQRRSCFCVDAIFTVFTATPSSTSFL